MAQTVKHLLTWDAGDLGLIPGSGRSPGEENGKPLQYPCLKNSMDRGAWQAIAHGAAKSWTRLTVPGDLVEGPQMRWLRDASDFLSGEGLALVAKEFELYLEGHAEP